MIRLLFRLSKRSPRLSMISLACALGIMLCVPLVNPQTGIMPDNTIGSPPTIEAQSDIIVIPYTPGINTAEHLKDLSQTDVLVESFERYGITVNLPEKPSEAATDTVNLADASVPVLASVPLDAELQHRILEESCKGDLRKFCIMMALANKETYGSFRTDGVDSTGLCYGLMQVKIDSHANRLTRLGYTANDLFDPVICVEVSLDYVEDLMENYQGSDEVTDLLFMMYNQGHVSARNSVKHGVPSTEYSRLTMGYYQGYMEELGLIPY